LEQLLAEYYDIFSLEGERGETDWEVDTGDELPRKQTKEQTVRRAARHEVADQLEKMQKNGVIKPSQSPWSGPVFFWSRRGTERFVCMDYRLWNSITKPDVFPLVIS